MISDLNLYKVFYIVSKFRNISRAADELYISQPAVSKSIKSLETQLNITLFFRNSKGVSLTKEGEMLFQFIEKAYAEILSGETVIKKLLNNEIGTINLGISSILGKNYFIPHLKNFVLKYPNLKVKISNKNTEEDLELLLKNRLDLAIVCKSSLDPSFEFIKLKEVQDIFVASPKYLKDNYIKNNSDLLTRGSFMLLEKGNITRNHLDNYFNNLSVSIIPDIEASNMDFLIECAKMDLGITSVLPDFIINELNDKFLVKIPLDIPIPPRYIGIAYKKNIPPSIASTTLINYLLKSNITSTNNLK